MAYRMDNEEDSGSDYDSEENVDYDDQQFDEEEDMYSDDDDDDDDGGPPEGKHNKELLGVLDLQLIYRLSSSPGQ